MKLEEEFSYSEFRSQNQDALYETLKANADSLAAGNNSVGDSDPH
jgi:hypothetical protein